MSQLTASDSRARRPLSLQARLLGLIGIITVVAGAIAAAIIFTIVYSSDVASRETRQHDAARAAAVRIVEFKSHIIEKITFLRTLQSDADLLARINLADALIANYAEMVEVVLVTSAGEVLRSAARIDPILTNAFTLPQSRWFTAARDGGAGGEDEVYIGDLQLTADGGAVLIMSARLNEGTIIGIAVSMEVLSETIREFNFAGTGQVYIVKENGQLIAHTDVTLVERGVLMADDPAFQRAVAGGDVKSIARYTNFRGEDVFGMSEPIPGTDWWVFTEVSSDEVFTYIRRIGAAIAIVIAGAIGAIVLSATMLIRRGIVRPLRALQGGTTAIAAGRLGYQVQVYNQDEIGRVAAQFNEMSAQLAARAAEREQLITDLQFAKRVAVENSRLKSEFLSTMSHELRTPLNAIEGFTSIMLGGMGIELGPRAEDMVRRVSGSSKRLLHLVNDFLDLSRIEAGRLELIDAPVNPADLASKWSRQVSVLGEEKGIAYHVVIDPALPETLLLDEDAVTKVAVNLLSNAFKFTKQGEVTLTLRRAGDAQWELCVRDTGIGIPPHAHEYIFEEFRQVDGSSKRLYGGTGLGLSLVQKLVRLMDGTVRLESETGRGSTFTITLPLKTRETETKEMLERTTT